MELVINSKSDGVDVALLEKNKLIELHQESGGQKYTVGDIYLAKVRKVVPSLNAAFVDVGYQKDAFLHYLDLGPQFSSLTKWTKASMHGKLKEPMLDRFRMEKDINKNGKINEILSSNQKILVQIAKEPISSKGPRLSSEITLAGRFLVLVPFSNKISVSQKMRDPNEKDRLKTLISTIRPKNFGVIIRTVAENKKVAELDQDLKDLVKKWNDLHVAVKGGKTPNMVFGELDRTTSILRDMLNKKFTDIHVDKQETFDEVKDYVASISPGQENIVKHYKGRRNIFEHYGISKQIKSSFGKQVTMPSGAYLVIEHTEAMHVVDVNSGNRKGGQKNQEENALAVNMEAAEELARVLRLRDMGGIIAVDFIDMSNRDYNKKLYNHLKDCMKDDRAKHSIIPPSKFGVVEITRQRVRPETSIKTAEVCPACHGTGEVKASILILDDIENSLRYIAEQGTHKQVVLRTHEFIASHLTKGWRSLRKTWMKKYKIKLEVLPMTAYTFLEYKFFDKDDEIID